jgi:hypothetical protein
LLIRCEIEADAPQLLWDCLNEGEQLRLLDWLQARPELWSLICAAIDLARETEQPTTR